MDTPDDSQLYRVETEGKYDSENRSATLHAARRGLTHSAHVDEGHILTGEFLTSRRESNELSPGENRIVFYTVITHKLKRSSGPPSKPGPHAKA